MRYSQYHKLNYLSQLWYLKPNYYFNNFQEKLFIFVKKKEIQLLLLSLFILKLETENPVNSNTTAKVISWPVDPDVSQEIFGLILLPRAYVRVLEWRGFSFFQTLLISFSSFWSKDREEKAATWYTRDYSKSQQSCSV